MATQLGSICRVWERLVAVNIEKYDWDAVLILIDKYFTDILPREIVIILDIALNYVH